MRNFFSIFIVLTAGILLLWWGTDGFHAFTAEGARRLAILETPKTVPPTTMQDQNGQTIKFGDYKGKLLLMTFIYTRCTDECPVLEKSFQDVYKGLSPERLGKDVSLLTVSFDTANDTVHELHHYAQYFDVNGTDWRMARVPDASELKRLLDQFGVKVIPDGNGGYEHNAAIYLIDRQGKLVQIFDFDDPRQVIQYVNGIL